MSGPRFFYAVINISFDNSLYFDTYRNMEIKDAVKSLSALAYEHRLEVFRMLVRCGPEGMAAGDIAETLDMPPSSLSFHLSQMETAGLITRRREQRHIIYAADIQGIRALLHFLTEDCCNGSPEICGNLIDDVMNC